MIFNIVVDAIVREHAYHFPSISVLFYADDGRILDVNGPLLQESLDFFADLFERVGMQMNSSKTKAMIGSNGSLRLQLSTPAYKRRLSGHGESYQEAQAPQGVLPSLR